MNPNFVENHNNNNKTPKSLKKTLKKSITKKVDSSKIDYAKTFVRKMFELTTIIKLYHWKTEYYASHKATDGLLKILNEIVDRYVETLLGKTAYKLKMQDYSNIPIKNLENNQQLEKYIKEIIEFLLEIHTHLNLEKDVDLLNLRDEIIGDLNRFLYLLRLK
jgi:hypothetical protein